MDAEHEIHDIICRKNDSDARDASRKKNVRSFKTAEEKELRNVNQRNIRKNKTVHATASVAYTGGLGQ